MSLYISKIVIDISSRSSFIVRDVHRCNMIHNRDDYQNYTEQYLFVKIVYKKKSFVYLSDTCTFSSQPFWTYESLYTFRFRENFSLNSHLTNADSGIRTHHLPATPWLCLMHTRQWKEHHLNHWTTEHVIGISE